MRQPLIDADILRYEVGFAVETGWKGDDSPPFDYVEDMLVNRISNICAVVEADTPPILYITGKTNFRNEIAKRRKYKERVGNKPYHFKNITAYMEAMYDVRQQEGLEADDLMSIEQTRRPGETIICSRDKDLFSVPGWKYSWELGRQPSRGPELVDEIGYIKLSDDGKKIIGCGDVFFYAQCLMGDVVDSIPGLKGFGPKKTFEALAVKKSRDCLYNQVINLYEEFYGEDALLELTEQARLLYLIRKQDGDFIQMWTPPNSEYEEWYNVNTKETKILA